MKTAKIRKGAIDTREFISKLCLSYQIQEFFSDAGVGVDE